MENSSKIMITRGEVELLGIELMDKTLAMLLLLNLSPSLTKMARINAIEAMATEMRPVTETSLGKTIPKTKDLFTETRSLPNA